MIAFPHAVLFMTLLGEQIGRAEHFDAPRHDSRIVNIAVAVLGGPVFYVVRPEWTFWLRRYVGDDLWIIVLLAALNALCWGAAIVAAVRWWRRRRRPIRGHAPSSSMGSSRLISSLLLLNLLVLILGIRAGHVT